MGLDQVALRMARHGDLPSASELGIDAALWNALASRVSKRTDRQALFTTRNRAVIIAVMALDAATDEWLAGYEARLAADPDPLPPASVRLGIPGGKDRFA